MISSKNDDVDVPEIQMHDVHDGYMIRKLPEGFQAG
jgi:hypothetical protein